MSVYHLSTSLALTPTISKEQRSHFQDLIDSTSACVYHLSACCVFTPPISRIWRSALSSQSSNFSWKSKTEISTEIALAGRVQGLTRTVPQAINNSKKRLQARKNRPQHFQKEVSGHIYYLRIITIFCLMSKDKLTPKQG